MDIETISRLTKVPVAHLTPPGAVGPGASARETARALRRAMRAGAEHRGEPRETCARWLAEVLESGGNPHASGSLVRVLRRAETAICDLCEVGHGAVSCRRAKAALQERGARLTKYSEWHWRPGVYEERWFLGYDGYEGSALALSCTGQVLWVQKTTHKRGLCRLVEGRKTHLRPIWALSSERREPCEFRKGALVTDAAGRMVPAPGRHETRRLKRLAYRQLVERENAEAAENAARASARWRAERAAELRDWLRRSAEEPGWDPGCVAALRAEFREIEAATAA